MDNAANPEKAKLLKAAQLAFKEGQWDKALDSYGKLLTLDKNDPEVLAYVADTYAKKRSTQLAFEFYYKAIPQFLAVGQVNEAAQCYQKITKLDLDKLSSDVRMDMNIYKRYVEIDEAIKNKRYELAVAPLSKLAKLRPQDPMIPALLKSIAAHIDHLPPSAQRYQTLGDTFLRNDFPDKAWEMYRKAIDLDPEAFSDLPQLAENFLKKGHSNEAKKAYLYLAEQTLALSNLNKAVEYAQKAIDLKSLEAGYILGLAHFHKRNWHEAKAEFEKLLRIKVNHLGALTHLGKTHAALSQPEKAKELFQRAFKVDENNPLIQEAWVEFCLQGPDKEAAIPQLAFLLEKVVTEHNAKKISEYSLMMIGIRPDLVSARIKLIQALQAMGDTQGAADACRALALVYEQQGLLKESAEYLEKANQLFPNYQEPPKVVESAPLPEALEQGTPIELPAIPEIPVESTFEPESEPEPVPYDDEPVIDPSVPYTTSAVEPPNPKHQAAPTTAISNPKSSHSTPGLPPAPIPIDSVSAQMATAQICINQGLLTAAIDIYQQIINANPNMTEARQKLNEANALYLKKWMEKKK